MGFLLTSARTARILARAANPVSSHDLARRGKHSRADETAVLRGRITQLQVGRSDDYDGADGQNIIRCGVIFRRVLKAYETGKVILLPTSVSGGLHSVRVPSTRAPCK